MNEQRSKADIPNAGNLDPAVYPAIPFDDADWAWFKQRAAVFGVDEADSHRPVIERLYGHLCGVNAWFNLTRITAPREYLKLHLLDSLSLWPDSRCQSLVDGVPCVDLGAGGGYPGLPLALWKPQVPWTLVDSRRRKVDFLAAAGSLVGPNVTAKHFRGREVGSAAPELFQQCQLVVSRAAGAVDKLLPEIVDMLAPKGQIVIYKGPNYSQEEHDRAADIAPKIGLRFVTVSAIQLEDDDPERLFVVFERTR
ncbi:MAG: class I SAM-dependent methyltransferase [Planctomycetota bacterium]|nr:class I SAM-dependent methyltransferase [Planctomycetota bacterium]